MGGTNALDRRHGRACSSGWAGRCGWTIRSSGSRIEGDRVTGVVSASGGNYEADLVATNGDVVHSYGLIKDHPRGEKAEAKLKRRTLLAQPVRGSFRA